MRGELDQTLALPVTTPVPRGTGEPKVREAKGVCDLYHAPRVTQGGVEANGNIHLKLPC